MLRRVAKLFPNHDKVARGALLRGKYMLIGLLALAAAGLFTGAAFYINFAEQPARLVLEDPPLVAVWKIAYRRGFALQASLAAIGFLLGLIAWLMTDTDRPFADQ
jgi:hypothetical protein